MVPFSFPEGMGVICRAPGITLPPGCAGSFHCAPGLSKGLGHEEGEEIHRDIWLRCRRWVKGSRECAYAVLPPCSRLSSQLTPMAVCWYCSCLVPRHVAYSWLPFHDNDGEAQEAAFYEEPFPSCVSSTLDLRACAFVMTLVAAAGASLLRWTTLASRRAMVSSRYFCRVGFQRILQALKEALAVAVLSWAIPPRLSKALHGIFEGTN